MSEKALVPIFRYELCTGCELCVEVCPEGALAMLDGLPQLEHNEICSYCSLCEEVCPSGAIQLFFEIRFAS
jgi:formate hydrogenlyase subunit 6/NADH:ubiquinone oxidoreductase subunit I